MTQNMQLVMNPGMIDEGAGHVGSHVGNVETYRADIKSECTRVLDNLGVGAGHEQHAAVMKKVDELIDQHVNALNLHKGALSNSSGTAQQTVQAITSNFGQTAL